jgi:hypothetical protein
MTTCSSDWLHLTAASWNVRDVDERLLDDLRRNQRDVLRPERGISD